MNQFGEERPSRNVLLQRVRNRIIQYLDLAASFEEQKKYQLSVPEVSVPNEVINQWEDWVSPEWKNQLIEPVFSKAEREGIEVFSQVLKTVAADISDRLPALDVLIGMPPWHALRDGAHRLLEIFSVRGKLSEERDDV